MIQMNMLGADHKLVEVVLNGYELFHQPAFVVVIDQTERRGHVCALRPLLLHHQVSDKVLNPFRPCGETVLGKVFFKHLEKRFLDRYGNSGYL